MRPLVFIFLLFFTGVFSQAKDIQTNELRVYGAPGWLKRVKVEKVTNRIQSKLEWSIRRTPVHWHLTDQSFSKAHSLGATPAAVTIKSKSKTEIHIGPKVTKENYQQILAHELVHLIFFQKYHGAIPRWLEEGFANHLSKQKPVNYAWLNRQKLPEDVTQMGHPYKGSRLAIRTHYKVSQALVEMLRKKCDLDNLIRLSVERKMADYIKSYCEISDINKAFKKWVAKKAKT